MEFATRCPPPAAAKSCPSPIAPLDSLFVEVQHRRAIHPCRNPRRTSKGLSG